MTPANIFMARATENCAAASGISPKTCPVFTARLAMFDQSASATPNDVTLRDITGQATVSVINTLDEIISGQTIMIARTGDDKWVRVTSEPGDSVGQIIQFQIDQDSLEPPEPSCTATVYGGGPADTTNLRGRVTWRPCGMEVVDGEDVNGYVDLVVGDNREYHTLSDRQGYAVRMRQPDGVCEWLVLIMWVRRDVVVDVIEMADELRIVKESHLIQDFCMLPFDSIPLEDCIEEPAEGV